MVGKVGFSMNFDIQTAGMYKRISAFLFDIIMLVIAIAGAGLFLSEALGYEGHLDMLNRDYARFEQEYNVSFEMTNEDYNMLTEKERADFDKAYAALSSDKEFMAHYTMVINLTLMIVSISVLTGYLIMEFALPICLKNGQTLGKKIFGIAVMHTSGISITPVLLFIRTVLGKYTLETMVPLFIIMMIFFNSIGVVGMIILGLILLVQLILVIATPTNSFLHDILAKTVVVDLQSQMIFKNGAELLEYKKKLHAEEVSNKDY